MEFEVSTIFFVMNRTSVNATINLTNFDIHDLIVGKLGEKRKDILSAVVLTVVYCAIFLTGLLGNVSTCIVITRNAYMHTVTNYYLLSLAVSDLALLLALPQEVYSIWEAYPWRFGEPFCFFKSFLLEATSYASVLTITGFTIERYLAICHPIISQKVSRQSRAVKYISLIWILSCLCALPYPLHTRLFYLLRDPVDHSPFAESLVCNIPRHWQERMLVMFQISTFAFFVIPMSIITVMYVRIGVKIRQTEINNDSGFSQQSGKTAAIRARRAVLRMLIAVVIAFFICWAPFHAQRLMTLYVRQWTSELLEFQGYLFYVSGVLYFVSSTVNPILYNVLSRKFRYAFKRTLCRCLIDPENFPTFFKLKAKFINRDLQSSEPSAGKYLFPDKPMRMATFYNVEQENGAIPMKIYLGMKPSTRDTVVKQSSTYASSSTTHAHSDGRLHYICRHKNCSSKRTRTSTESQAVSRNPNNSYQDIETLKRMQELKTNCHIIYTFDSSIHSGEKLL